MIGERVVNKLEPAERDIAMVFQNYALYPHMSVFDNMAYGLKIAKVPKPEIEARVQKAAKILELGGLLDRTPRQLSGGQRQRVAMGRAIVRQPQVFLFDEPLSNLDAKLRAQTRLEIQKLHRELGVTSLFVTHDQVEAMTLAQRMVVMNAGRLEQIGTPDEVYARPATTFVASFIGSPPMNLLPGKAQGRQFTIGDVTLNLQQPAPRDGARHPRRTPRAHRDPGRRRMAAADRDGRDAGRRAHRLRPHGWRAAQHPHRRHRRGAEGGQHHPDARRHQTPALVRPRVRPAHRLRPAMAASGPSTPWPYPRWIAHRGAGKLAPENTLAAFRLGAAHGYRAYECDVKLSADGVPFLLHDATLERTTNGRGHAGDQPWSELSRLDAGGWHSRAYAGETMPTLQAIAAFVRANGHLLNIEIKPTPGQERETGAAVARAAAQAWAGAPVPPLLSSFRPDALATAREAVPDLPRALLVDELWPGWLDSARQLGCVAVVTNHKVMDATTIEALRGAGLRGLCYTVNDGADVVRLLALGIDGLITDAVDRFAPVG